MKAVKVGKYQIDIILEDDKYIDIYTYYDFDDGSTLTLDNGKGWRLNELTRYDRESGIEYKVSAEPNRFKIFEGFEDFEIRYIKNNVAYKRLLIINDNYGEQYVTQDMISSERTDLLTDEIRKKYRVPKNSIEYGRFGGKTSIQVKGDKVTIFERIREFSTFFSDSWCDVNNTVEKYIFDSKNDFDNTNNLLQNFYNFSRSIYVFGCEDEEPRIVKIVGNHTATYEVVRSESGVSKILCMHPNKYVKQRITTFSIDE